MEPIWAALTACSVAAEHGLSKKQLDTSLKEQVAIVKQLLTAQRNALADNFALILTRLDPRTDSIPVLLILQTGLDEKKPPPGVDRLFVLDRILQFLLEFNPYHIRYVGSSFRALLEYVVAGRAFTTLVATEAVASAMLRMDPSGSMFTSTHLSLARRAYETDDIEPALKVLNQDITFYPNMSGQKEARFLCEESLAPASYISVDTGLTESVKSTAVLEYSLLCGFCYMALKDWPKAQRALERVITHPSRDKGVSQIMADAYKRWLLVGLLRDGKEPTLPAHTSPLAKNAYSTLATPYQSIAAKFATTDVAQLRGEVETNRAVWVEDKTNGIIAEVMAAYQKWQVINLRFIYHQISISQVRRVTLSAETGEPLKDDQEVLSLLQSMSESKMLNGELQLGNSGEESYLLFQEDDTSMTEVEFAREIAQSHHNIKSLGQQYQAVNERLSGSKEYVKHVIREQKRAEREGSDAGVGFDTQIEDEDLMTGIIPHT
ncbi:Fc.00g098360.m01.CDS01 [Cosmosporella sp. VM-42]